MRKLISLLFVLCILTTSIASAESFVMAGYDTSTAGRDWTTNLFFANREKATGISFEYQEYTDAESWRAAKASMLNNGELPDMLFMATLSDQETLDLYHAGKIIDLKPYLADAMPNLSALLAEHPDWEKAISLPDGAIAALPMINELPNNNVIWINKTWLRNIGQELPTTAEELTNVLRLFKTKDPNQNGSQDETPLVFTSLWDLKFLGHAFGMVANDYSLYQNENGEVSSVLTTPENRSFLEWLHTLYTEGLISKDGFSNTDSLMAITDSKAAITYGVLFGTTPLRLLPSTALNDYTALMPLQYNGKQVYRRFLPEVTRGTCAITSACADPATLLGWIDYLYSEEGMYTAQAGIQGQDWDRSTDGTWYWTDNGSELSDSILPAHTLADGSAFPCFTTAEYQLTFDSEDTTRLIQELAVLQQYSKDPTDHIFLSENDLSRLDSIQLDMANWAERRMVHFITGEVALNDDSWADFCATVQEKGLDELVSIWNNTVMSK